MRNYGRGIIEKESLRREASEMHPLQVAPQPEQGEQ
jgi:hypothetical protein